VTGFGMGPAILFCPGDRPDRYAKAAERADAGILDLEDAVAPADRAAAREAVVDHRLDPERTIVRINPAGSSDFAADLQAAARAGYRTIMLAKTESAADVRAVGELAVVALCETAAGVLNVSAIAAEPATVALMWGAEDLLASLGGTSSRFETGIYRDVARQARSQVLLAAGAFGKAAIDSVYLDLADHEGLAAEAADAVASGFAAKAIIHPGQADVIRKAYRPSRQEADYASAVLEAAQHESGVFRFRGRMIDGPLLKLAEQTLQRAGVPLLTADQQQPD
jgi:citrate lyase subunit beta / citryl-CoA lyase